MRFLAEDTPLQGVGSEVADLTNYEGGAEMFAVILIVVAAVFGCIVATRWYWAGGINTHSPDLTDQIIVVTGANTGLGYESVKFMSNLNAKTIVLACRSEERASAAITQIKKCNKVENIVFMKLDLSDLQSVKEFAAEFNEKYDKLDILLNNAGIMALPVRQQTVQGIEKQLGVNHVGHFLLTTLLFDKVKAAPFGRIINVSSLAHDGATRFIGGLNMKDLNWEQSYNAVNVYSQSKIANIYFTKKLAQRLDKEKITNIKVVSLHPGVVRTELDRNMITNKCVFFMSRVICFPVGMLF